jgi:hypothetical protein
MITIAITASGGSSYPSASSKRFIPQRHSFGLSR